MQGVQYIVRSEVEEGEEIRVRRMTVWCAGWMETSKAHEGRSNQSRGTREGLFLDKRIF